MLGAGALAAEHARLVRGGPHGPILRPLSAATDDRELHLGDTMLPGRPSAAARAAGSSRPFTSIRPSRCAVVQAATGRRSSADEPCARELAQPAAAMALAALVLLGGTPVGTQSVQAAVAPQTWTGPARVVDGDTLYIGEQKFRLYGVDAPEKTQSCADAKGQAYACGLISKDRLAQKIGNQTVSCTRRNKDQYGREVAVCSLVGGGPLGGGAPEDLNRWLVDNGLAVAYREYGKDYVGAEEAARAAHRGIWSGTFEYPAQWRKEEKAGVQHPPLSAPLAYQPPPLPPPPRAAPPPSAQQQVAIAPPRPAAPVPTDLCGKGVLPIKGNINSKGTKIYHLPGGPYYEKVLVEPEKGESYFCSEADAVKAGYRAVASAASSSPSSSASPSSPAPARAS